MSRTITCSNAASFWLVLDNMLVKDPNERSSAEYCHDEALKVLQRITNTRRQESDDDYDSSPTPNLR